MTLFHSKEVHGVKMNQFGVVLREDSSLASIALRDFVWREARAAGWTLVPSENRDEGLVWTAPKAEGTGEQ